MPNPSCLPRHCSFPGIWGTAGAGAAGRRAWLMFVVVLPGEIHLPGSDRMMEGATALEAQLTKPSRAEGLLFHA